MKYPTISVSILLISSLGIMVTFAETTVNPSRTVPTTNQPTVSMNVDPNKTISATEPKTEADILADPNRIEAAIKAFEGLQEKLDELDRKGERETRQWLQKETGNRIPLAKDNHEHIMAELMFIRKLAVEENAKKTTAAIDGLLLNRQQQLDKLIEKFHEERLEERKESRRERSTRSRQRPRQEMQQDRRTRGRQSEEQQH